MIVDRDERQRILQEIHEGEGDSSEGKASSSHIGQDKTECKILQSVWWPGIRGDVRAFINACDQCQKRLKRFQRGAEGSYSVQESQRTWEQIGVEMCHMPKSKDGSSYVAVAVDYFTKWVEAAPLPTRSAESLASFLYGLICRHGFPEIHINDKEKEFVSQVSDHLESLAGVKVEVTGAYDPQANKLFKPLRRIIQELPLKIFSDNADVTVDNWPKALPGVLFALRTCNRSGLEFTPFYLLYKRHPRLPSDFTPNTSGDSEKDQDADGERQCDTAGEPHINFDSGYNSHEQDKRVDHSCRDTAKTQSKDICVSESRQTLSSQKRKLGKKGVAVGDRVLLCCHSDVDREGSWSGPYSVTKQLDGGQFELQDDEGTVVESRASVADLKPYTKKKRLIASEDEWTHSEERKVKICYGDDATTTSDN